MVLHKRLQLFSILFSLVLTIGCSALQENILKPEYTPPKQYSEEYLRQGSAYEKAGDRVAALKQYSLALTVDPSNTEALSSRNRLKKQLESSAEANYQKGLALRKEGKYSLARAAFLKALRQQPNHAEALKMLLQHKRFEIKRHILHQVKSGDTLARLAAFYYGDYQKFPIIAEYNRISDAARIKVGELIKIPEIKGSPFLDTANDVIAEFEPLPYFDPSDLQEYPIDSEPEKEPGRIETAKVSEQEQVSLYLELGANLFQEEKLQDALEEFKKVLKVQPENSTAVDYLCRLHLQLADEHLEQSEFLAARDEYRKALKYDDSCRDCLNGIHNSENLYKDFHYKKGIQHFNNEQLLAAIEEWELVRDLDPNYKRINDLIQKAQTILKNIEAIRAMEQEENPN